MGQYYKAVSLENHSFMRGDFLKLMETSYIGNAFLNSVEALLYKGGAWYKTGIVWAGDYMDDNIFLTSEQVNCECDDCINTRKSRKTSEDTGHITLYGYAKIHFKEISVFMSKHNTDLRFICNHTKKLFVDLRRIKKDKDGYRIHPLPILTCSGNDRGGGDFHETDTYPYLIGSWAGDIISMEPVKPERMSELIPNFQYWPIQ